MQLELVEPLPPGHRLEEYSLLNVLGQGGFGTTYLAEDRNLGKQFVIKELTPHHLVRRGPGGVVVLRVPALADMFGQAVCRFKEEAQRIAHFNHPNIVRVSRYLQGNDTGYIVMDYEAGGTLRDLMNSRKSPFSEIELRGLIAPLCAGVAQMHSVGLVHRDIKPDNIVLRPDGTPVLIDFGAAGAFAGAASDEFPMVATPGYAPPEQIDPAGQQGPWTDVYALGATLYELIASVPLLAAQLRAQSLNGNSASELGRGRFSTQLLAVVDRCIALDIDARPKTLADLLTLLQAPDEGFSRLLVSNISNKMLQHFMNFARPNDQLLVDELSIFFASFPALDLAWRIGSTVPTGPGAGPVPTFDNGESLAKAHQKTFRDAGFRRPGPGISRALVADRMDEYAAAYLVDRTEPQWTYDLLCRQAARRCLAPEAAADIEGFSTLLSDVVDGARGRIRKAVTKRLDPYSWIMTPGGWTRVTKEEEP